MPCPSSNHSVAEEQLPSPDRMVTGQRYFFRVSRRTDEFRHKRYSNPEVEKWEAVVVMGQVLEQRGGEVAIIIEECGMSAPDPVDGERAVISTGCGLTVEGGAFRTLEEHGKPNVELGKWLA